jgi:hypothetical protein
MQGCSINTADAPNRSCGCSSSCSSRKHAVHSARVEPHCSLILAHNTPPCLHRKTLLSNGAAAALLMHMHMPIPPLPDATMQLNQQCQLQTASTQACSAWLQIASTQACKRAWLPQVVHRAGSCMTSLHTRPFVRSHSSNVQSLQLAAL